MRQLREEIADPKLHRHPVYPELGIYCFDDFADHSDTYAAASQSLARSLQDVTNDVLADYFNSALERAEDTLNLSLAGGVALNCVANAEAFAASQFDALHVPPCPHDGGLALGMALFTWHHVLDQPRRPGHFDPYGGPILREAEFADAAAKAQSAGLSVREIDNGGIVNLLAAGNIIGMCRGRSESGPRALGHRSILCRTDLPDIVQRLNDIKRREWFQPFAPIILASHADQILQAPFPSSPYMNIAAVIKPNWRERMTGVCHADHSTRPQIIERHHEPALYEIIEALHDQTGVPAILNTSFNCQEPIVESPAEALATFEKTQLNGLVIGDYYLCR